MIHVPALAPHVRLVTEGEVPVGLLSELEEIGVRGSALPAVLRAIDGRRSTDAIAGALAPEIPPAETFYVFELLRRKGVVVEADLAPGMAAWTAQGMEPGVARERLACRTVGLCSTGSVPGLDALRDALAELSVRVAPEGEDLEDLRVVVTDDYLDPRNRAHHDAALRDGRPWMLVRAGGARLWLGPVFRPGEAPCWRCLVRRAAANLPVHALASRDPGGAAPPSLGGPGARRAALALAAAPIARALISPALSDLVGNLLTLDLFTLRSEVHAVVPVPDCPECSAALRLDPAPVSGGSADAFLARFERLASPLTGVARPIVPDGRMEDSGFRVCTSGFTTATAAPDPRAQGAAGKGVGLAAARAGALGEALERYSAHFHVTEPRFRARFSELGPRAIHPHTVLGFSERQYRERAAWVARGSRFTFVPLPFDPEVPVEWTTIRSLASGAERYLPTSCCYREVPQAPEETFGVGCSNGCAAGATFAHATLHGLLELVERDAVALWWYNRVRRPGVDLESFGSPAIRRFERFLAERGRSLHALDVTSDLQVPTFAAISCLRDGGGAITFGFAADVDAAVAIERATAELAQTCSVLLPRDGARGADLDAIDDPETLRWLRHERLAAHPYLLPAGGAPARRRQDFPRDAVAEPEATLDRLTRRLEGQGLDVLVLDQTRAEIGLPVAKVIVPGLRHLWARFAPGRLYDVPVEMGWRDAPADESQLNPSPMFL